MKTSVFPEKQAGVPLGSILPFAFAKHNFSPACDGCRADHCPARESCPLALFFSLDVNGKKSLDPFEMNYTPVIAAATGQY